MPDESDIADHHVNRHEKNHRKRESGKEVRLTDDVADRAVKSSVIGKSYELIEQSG